MIGARVSYPVDVEKAFVGRFLSLTSEVGSPLRDLSRDVR